MASFTYIAYPSRGRVEIWGSFNGFYRVPPASVRTWRLPVSAGLGARALSGRLTNVRSNYFEGDPLQRAGGPRLSPPLATRSLARQWRDPTPVGTRGSQRRPVFTMIASGLKRRARIREEREVLILRFELRNQQGRGEWETEGTHLKFSR